MLFPYRINSLAEWGRVFQNRAVFELMARTIFDMHALPYDGLLSCTPGSNAVFRVGDYLLKIFAPEESGIGGERDFLAEKNGLRHAEKCGVAVPEIIAEGVLTDRYVFRYLILRYIDAPSLDAISEHLSPKERFRIGRELRAITERMDTPCDAFTEHSLLNAESEKRWRIFEPEFLNERARLISSVSTVSPVFVHGDLNPDNILIDQNGKICLIDFADALSAPIEYEHAAMICEGFRFDRDYLLGFCGGDDPEELTHKLVFGLMIHDYGAYIIRDRIALPSQIRSLEDLREKILFRVRNALL